jgi:hypothetical protein
MPAPKLEDVLSTYENVTGKGKGVWVGTPEASVGLEVNVDSQNPYVGVSVHDHKHNKLAHGICFYINKQGQPMLQASDNTRVEHINLLDLIEFIKKQMVGLDKT